MRLHFLTLLLACGLCSHLAAADRPNVLLVLVDDVGYSDFGCYGSEIATPHIDQLARDGLLFARFYNNAVCSTTRASLLTGLYPRYFGHNASVRLTDNMTTVAELLHAAGYHTSLSGKWHLGREPPHHPLDRGFDAYYGLLDGCCNHHDPSIQDPAFEGGRFRFWADGRQRVTEFPDGFYSTDAITDHAIAQVRQARESRQPFFAHVCYTAAHSPLHAKPADIAKYRGRYDAGWDQLRRERFARQVQAGLFEPDVTLPLGEPEFGPWSDEPLKEWNANLMAVYAAMIDCIDQNVGRLLATLDELDVSDETIVMVLSDNGGCAEQAGGDDPTNIAGPKQHYVSCGAGWAHAQNTPFRRYKAWCHEGGIATPMIVRWPGVAAAGRITFQVGHVMDVLPTLIEALGIEYPSRRGDHATLPLEGRSLLATINEPDHVEPRKLHWACVDNRAIRDGRWKAAWDQSRRAWELYDLDADPVESGDLSAEEPSSLQTMVDDWTRWAAQTGADRRLGQQIILKP